MRDYEIACIALCSLKCLMTIYSLLKIALYEMFKDCYLLMISDEDSIVRMTCFKDCYSIIHMTCFMTVI